MGEFLKIEFLRPEFLLLACLAAPVFFMLLREAKFGRYFRRPAPGARTRTIAPFAVLRALSGATLLVALACVVADPRYPIVKRSEIRQGTDIVFVFDISKSMLAEDLSPNRLEAAKSVLQKFVQDRPGDRFGLVVFAGKPFVISPLTSDVEAFVSLLSRVTTDTIRQEFPGFSGTNIGEGLLLASESLSGSTGDKNLVLVTDGEANMGIDPKPVAKFLAERKVKVHSVGIGDPKGIDLFVTDKRTGTKVYFRGNDGNPIRAIVDSELLAFLSTTTSGIFASSKDAAGLAKIFDAIDSATKKPVSVETVKRYATAKFPFLVLASLALLSLSLLAVRISDDPSA